MPSNNPISTPAGYAPAFAVGYSDQGGALAIVDAAKPLPVVLTSGTPITVQPVSPVVPPALEGVAETSLLAGPFAPVSGRSIILALSGVWEGSVQVERSIDAGTTRHKLTAAGIVWGYYTGNACEIVWVEDEADAELFLDIAITSGTLNYRMAQ